MEFDRQGKTRYMRHSYRFAAASVLALALAACGPAEEPAGEDAAAAPAAEAANELPAAGEETPAAAETPAADATATPTPAPTASASAAAAPAAAPAPVAAVARPASFAQCAVCHSVEPGQNGIGPSLAGIHGNRAGQVAGFSYTPGMRSSGLTWNDATLDRYLTDPQGVVPGTMMAIGPLDAAQRRAIIAYLKTL
jgi:cytochrome c